VSWADFDPRESFSGQRLAVTGRYLPDQLLVTPRDRAGKPGSWVYTVLIPDSNPGSETMGRSAGADDEPEVAGIGVLRGWVPHGTDTGALTPPAGRVAVTGVLVADERRPGSGATPGADGVPTLARVDSGVLAEVAGIPVRAGWLALTASSPATAGDPAPLEVEELPGADVGLNWRNAAYAGQWLAFAAFAVFFWNRFRRDYFGSGEPEELLEETEA
jgi:cytochrome oxidase assembly protein ShyY1